MDGNQGVPYRARMKQPSIVQGVLIAILAVTTAAIPATDEPLGQSFDQDSKRRSDVDDASGSLESTIVFEVVKDGYPHIRIPSILKLADGTLLAFAQPSP